MLTCTAPVHQPRNLAEALAQRAVHPFATVLAGGTDVMVYLEGGTLKPTALLDLWRVDELRGITTTGGVMRIGALSTWTDVAGCVALPGALRDCARTVGAAQIQNRGTVGGNIVNASPAGDSLPMWLALDAVFELRSWRGTRKVPATAFWEAYKRTALAADELLTAVLVPAVAGEVRYRKVGTRLAQAISKVVLGVRVALVDGRVSEARVAYGSVGPVPARAAAVEERLVGHSLTEANIDAAIALLDIRPLDDVRSTADYRNEVARRVLRAELIAL
jgi:CO/xanthine dehydrogenase FAD-binding subunit